MLHLERLRVDALHVGADYDARSARRLYAHQRPAGHRHLHFRRRLHLHEAEGRSRRRAGDRIRAGVRAEGGGRHQPAPGVRSGEVREGGAGRGLIRLGFLVPPANPTTEPEAIRLAPPGVTAHFTRMIAGGEPGSHQGQEERNRTQIEHMEACARLLALVKPAVIVMAHTATSYTLGREGEAALVAKIERATGIPFITAFAAVLEALAHLSVRRVALATPYARETTLRGKAHLEAHGIDVVSWGNLEDVKNIYDET